MGGTDQDKREYAAGHYIIFHIHLRARPVGY
jgi:hypothetical protein